MFNFNLLQLHPPPGPFSEKTLCLTFTLLVAFFTLFIRKSAILAILIPKMVLGRVEALPVGFRPSSLQTAQTLQSQQAPQLLTKLLTGKVVNERIHTAVEATERQR